MNEEKVVLEDTNFNLGESLFDLRCKNVNTDINLVTTNGVKFPVHQLILNIYPHFNKILKQMEIDGHDWRNYNYDITVPKSDDAGIMEIIVKYMYTGKVEYTGQSEDHFIKLLEASYNLELNSLKQLCFDYKMDTLNKDSKWLPYFKLTNKLDINNNKLFNYLRVHLKEDFIFSSGFQSLEFDELKVMISTSPFMSPFTTSDVKSKGVLEWIRKDTATRGKYFDELNELAKKYPVIVTVSPEQNPQVSPLANIKEISNIPSTTQSSSRHSRQSLSSISSSSLINTPSPARITTTKSPQKSQSKSPIKKRAPSSSELAEVNITSENVINSKKSKKNDCHVLNLSQGMEIQVSPPPFSPSIRDRGILSPSPSPSTASSTNFCLQDKPTYLSTTYESSCTDLIFLAKSRNVNSIMSYSFATQNAKRFAELGDFGIERSSLIASEKHFYTLGGKIISTNPIPTDLASSRVNSLAISDFYKRGSSGFWKQEADLRTPKYNSSALIIRKNFHNSVTNIIYLIGGNIGQNQITNSVEKIEIDEKMDRPAEWEDNIEHMEHYRDDLGVTFLRNKIYMIGGTGSRFYENENENVPNETDLVSLNTAETFDLITNQQEIIPPMKIARSGVRACSLRNKIFSLGGSNREGTEKYNSVEIFDVQTQTWTDGPSMIYKRSSGCAFVMDGEIHYCGGNGTDGTEKPTIERLDRVKNKWREVKSGLPEFSNLSNAAILVNRNR